MTQSEPSDYDRLFYPFLFEGSHVRVEDVLAQVRHSGLEKSRDVIALRKATLARNHDLIVAAGRAMSDAFAAGATFFAFGNGGSTTDAQDIVADLLAPAFPDWRPLPAISLTGDIAVITAVANDVGFDNVFARQVIAFGKPGDIAFGISTSGNSKNVLVALDQAKKQGLLTIGLAGYDGGKMSHMSTLDYCLVSPSDHIPRIQESQATICHALLEIVQVSMKELRR